MKTSRLTRYTTPWRNLTRDCLVIGAILFSGGLMLNLILDRRADFEIVPCTTDMDCEAQNPFLRDYYPPEHEDRQ